TRHTVRSSRPLGSIVVHTLRLRRGKSDLSALVLEKRPSRKPSATATRPANLPSRDRPVASSDSRNIAAYRCPKLRYEGNSSTRGVRPLALSAASTQNAAFSSASEP